MFSSDGIIPLLVLAWTTADHAFLRTAVPMHNMHAHDACVVVYFIDIVVLSVAVLWRPESSLELYTSSTAGATVLMGNKWKSIKLRSTLPDCFEKVHSKQSNLFFALSTLVVRSLSLSSGGIACL